MVERKALVGGFLRFILSPGSGGRLDDPHNVPPSFPCCRSVFPREPARARLVAEQRGVNQVHPAHLVHVGAKVEPALAEAVRQLADNGDRSLSREIRRAIAEHVERATDPGGSSSPRLALTDHGEGGGFIVRRRPPTASGETP
jgi:hypothetical protein